MRRNISFILTMIVLSLVFMTGCTYRLKKDVVGIWRIRDIEIVGDTSLYDPVQLKENLDEQKKIWFEIRPEYGMAVYTEASRINGSWNVKWRGRGLYAKLEGGSGKLLLGSYHDGLLVHRDTTALGTILITTFLKEVPPEEERK